MRLFLGRKKGLEDLFLRFPVHAYSGPFRHPIPFESAT
jgi:hypothetical protein